jgi:hypothetical protein
MNDPDRRVIAHLTDLTEAHNMPMATDADPLKPGQAMVASHQVATLATHYGASPLAVQKP